MGSRLALHLALVLLITTSFKVSANDLYWEGEEDLAHEFLEVNEEPGTLQRIKRGFFDFFGTDDDTATDSPDDLGAGKEDDSDSFGSGVSDKTSTEPREKTLRVTFKIQEPYRDGYSDRDSKEFLELSQSLAHAVDELYESLPGTQKASLVRIQSLVNDQWACKVALDIVTTGYDNTDKIKDILQDHIKNSRRLGETMVFLEDFSAQIIDPALVTDPSTQIYPDEADKNVDNNVDQPVDQPLTYDGSQDNNGNPDENLDNSNTNNYYQPTPDNENNGNGDNSDVDTGYPDNNNYDQTLDNNFPDQTSTERNNGDDGNNEPDENNEVNNGEDGINNNGGNESSPSPWSGGRGDLGEANNNNEDLPETTPEPRTADESNYFTTTPSPSTTEASGSGGQRCVELEKRCDGTSDCYDGADEQGCAAKSCASDDFRCDNGQCIPRDKVCDRVNDCQNLEDESNCECAGDEFRCVTSGLCIEGRKRCDGTQNCDDGSDEEGCLEWAGHHVCHDIGKFRCHDGKCISILLRCDGYRDCKDGGDEIGCPCNHNEWQCDHGTCIKRSERCDGRVDCPTDRSDERNCLAAEDFKCDNGNVIPLNLKCNHHYDCGKDDISDERNCPCGETDFRCDNGFCIPDYKVCDKTNDCQDRSDERGCSYGTICMASEYKCANGMCVPADARCNGTVECDDYTDELSCPCKRDQFPCRDGSCINVAYRCNGRPDCSQGEDEHNCASICPPEQYMCPEGSSRPCATKCDGQTECDGGEDEDGCEDEDCALNCDGRCIPADKICDQVPDCNDGSDETDCDLCNGPDDFRCNSKECLSYTLRCNGIKECEDGSDEHNCNGTMISSTSCGQDQFKCQSGTCINYLFYCDGNEDCSDGSDESNCQCPNNSWQCRDGACIASYSYCDGIQDCGDGSDEEDCPPPTTTSSPIWPAVQPPITTTEGFIRPVNYPGYPSYQTTSRYPSYEQTPDPYGQQGGNTTPDPYEQQGGDTGSDPYGQQGGNRYPDQSGQNGGGRYPDQNGQQGGSRYPDQNGQQGGDRYPDQSGQNGGGRYPDQNGQQGGSRYPDQNGQQGGDRYPDQSGQNGGGRYPNQNGQQGGNRYPDSNGRPGGRPSSNYPPYGGSGGCPPNQWRCENGPCIPSYKKCDGHIDCPFDYSDEFDCPRNSPVALNLKIHPENQTIRHGGDVVFQCRDEGPQRASVRWIRPDRSLKQGSTDVRGRLEMFGVTESDSGVYICQASDFIGQPGAEKRVTLYVDRPPVTYRPPFIVCKTYEATCGTGQCIPKTAVCDGRVDCQDGSDENACHHQGLCEPNQFKCNNNRCVLKSWRCDSEDDCGDGSDESECGVSEPGKCTTTEFTCAKEFQCIPKSFQCDGNYDCLDKTDETCVPMFISQPPTPKDVRLNPGDTLTLSCKAVGVPVPYISWRLNWGHVPPQCVSTTDNGEGLLICHNMQPEHSGAYSCEAINNRATTIATPDAIVFVNKTDPCPRGYFNKEARTENECINCFCFGRSTECRSADLFTYNMPTPLGQGGTMLIGVIPTPSGDVQLDNQPISSQYHYQPTRNGATVTKYGDLPSWSDSHPYLTLPESYKGNQLKSYGGHIKYTLTPQTAVYQIDNSAPTIIIKGKYGNLFHVSQATGSRDFNIEVRLTPEHWRKGSPSGYIPASREDIMMTLNDIEMILLRADLNNAGVSITDFAMESADQPNVGLGIASLVEECTCPREYDGLSCQKCAPGYSRKKVGPWLGVCEAEQCPPGTYGDPSRGLPCNLCPCPLTNPENQFARTCSLGPSGQAICDCLPGYQGIHCEVCAEGYEGNPLLPGDSCRPRPSVNCNPTGTKSIRPPDECVCKDNVNGRFCDQCKNDSFYLSEDFRHGCALCFCSGVTQQCMSGNLRRKTINVQFNVPQIVDQVKVFKVSPPAQGSLRYAAPVETELKPELFRGDVSLRSLESSPSDVFYWSLPASFAGDLVTAYGGNLRYTLKNVPNDELRTAADVQLVSVNAVYKYNGGFRVSNDGTLNATIQLLEKGWQRPDGKEVPREYFLMALADVKAILIKASYSPSEPLAIPISASIDIATPDGYGPTAYHVEQCTCPAGYVGTSCEDCAPGYARGFSGLYLRHCEPCECNGKSNICNPETGACYNCRDNTEGDQCESCKPGYERDQNENCVPISSGANTACPCDPRGIDGPCDGNDCRCKANVEGPLCDRCRPGTFGLDANNPEGCLTCFCSGATNDCHEGNHYVRWPLPAPVLGDDYGGFALTDLNAERVIKDNFVPMFDQSELIYTFSFSPSEDLYWSLPVFPGNRVLSYGGSLSLRQKFSSSSNEISQRGTDVVLDGGDVTLYWSNPNQFQSGRSYSFQVPLKEDNWYILNSVTPATRTIFMSVLKNLKRVLVRATIAPNIYETTIADVSMDTANQNFEKGLQAAKDIEICMCPPGFTGTSCETCENGYYKDQSGMCRKCNCNGHNCQLDSRNQVICNCQPPYTGPDCGTIGLVMELHPKLEPVPDDPDSRRVTFTCKYSAPEPLTIIFYHMGEIQNPRKFFTESRKNPDGSWHGHHKWDTIWNTKNQDEVYECHVVTERNRTLGILTTSLPEPGGDSQIDGTTHSPPPPEPTVIVKITSPTIKIQEVGSSVNFTCFAQSRFSSRRLPVKWSKSGGYLPQGRTQIDHSSGILLITNLQISDSGKYICETSDGVNTAQAIATLKVPGNEMSAPTVEIQPSVQDYYEGDRVELQCRATGNPSPTIRWQSASNRPLPPNAQFYENLLIIESARPENTGEYRCVASNDVGSVDRTAMITIRPRPAWPPRDTLTISNLAPVVNEGESIRVVCTGTTNVPAGSINWVRQDNAGFSPNVQSVNGVLLINFAAPQDQGVYVCQSLQADVSPVPVLVTVVSNSLVPDNPSNITVSVSRLRIPTGGSGTIDCNPVGRPIPLIRWTKHESSFGPGSSQRGNTLIINNAQDDDKGYYVCEGTVNGQSISRIYVYVEIETREQPKVEIWPPGEQSVPLGGIHELMCRVLGGTPEPAVTWSRSGGRPLSKQTEMLKNNVLRFNNIEVNDEGEYTCTASNVAGTGSASAVIKVRSPPEITITPSSSVQVDIGEQINVECRANGYPEPTVYIAGSDNRQISPPSLGYAALRISSASERDNGIYTCFASSVAGNINDQFMVTVNRGDGGDTGYDEGSGDPEPPYDPNQGEYDEPKSLYAIEGTPITLDCLKPGKRVIWSRADSQPLQRNANQVGTQLIINNVSKKDSGEYVCSVYNSLNEVEQEVYTNLEVVLPPKITLRPPKQTVSPGQSPTVECIVEGDNIIDITWRPYNRLPSNRVDTKTSVLTFHRIEVEDAGEYECFVRSQYGNASAIAGVVVNEDPNRGSVSHDHEQTAHVGSAVQIACNFTQPNARPVWTKNGRPLPKTIRQKNDGSLFIRHATKSDAGTYICSLRQNGKIVSSNYVNLHVEGHECLETEFRCYDNSDCVDERLLCDGQQDCSDNSDEQNCLWRDKRYTIRNHDGARDPDSQRLVYIEQPNRPVFRVGDNVNVLCRLGSRDVRAQWERPGTNEYVDSITYGDGTMLRLRSVSYTDAGVYRCVGSNSYGQVSSDDFTLVIEPGANQPPVGDWDKVAYYTAHLRDSVDMPCIHNLEEPVVFEWSREYDNLRPDVRSDQPYLRLESVTDADAGTYVCRVHNSRTAVSARAVLTVSGIVPNFGGDSFISMPTLRDAFTKFEIEISFRPGDRNGLLLYNSENQGREGDFIALHLHEGIPEFLIKTGVSGTMTLRGDRPLELNAWHTIRVNRVNYNKVTMDVDNLGPFTMDLAEQWEVLDLHQNLYIGGVPDYDQLPVELAGTSGLIGCVSILILGRAEVNIMLDSIERSRITECNTCASNRCINGGVCQEARTERGYTCICGSGYAGLNCDRSAAEDACRPGLCGPGRCQDLEPGGYRCSCPITHTGTNCEIKQSIEYPAFTGTTFLAIKPPAPSRSLKMSMKIKASAPITDGIIMYCAENSKGYGGFTSLAVHDGRLEFRYDLGEGTKPVVLVSNIQLSANDWTDVHIARVGSVVSLKINFIHKFEERLNSPQKRLNLETPIFVGGVDESIVLNNNTGVTGGFNGCIKDFTLDGTPVDIVNATIQSANVKECAYDRGDTPDETCHCLNGGTCTTDFDTCECPPGFTGDLCQQRSFSRAPSYFSRPPRNPCEIRPCQNNGTCRPAFNTRLNYTCDCPLGYAGDICQMRLELFQSVGFNGNGYLELPSSLMRYDDLGRDPAVIAIAMHTTQDGVLLYHYENTRSRYGDYLLLRIERGYVIFEWDLGGGAANVTVPVFVNNGDSHRIVAKLLEDGRATLAVENSENSAVSKGISTVMNADSNIYLGGIPESLNIRRLPGFTGCIEQIELMSASRGLNLGALAVTGRNAQRCKEPPRRGRF